MPVATVPSAVTHKNISKHCQMSPWEGQGDQRCPVENNCLAYMNAWGKRNSWSVSDCVRYIIDDCFLERHNTKAKNLGHIQFSQSLRVSRKNLPLVPGDLYQHSWESPINELSRTHERGSLCSWGSNRSPVYEKAAWYFRREATRPEWNDR